MALQLILALTLTQLHTPSLLPQPPAVTYAVPTGPDQVTIGWADNSTNETGFTVYLYGDIGYATVGTTGPNVTSASFGVNTSLARIFVVSASNGSGQTYSDTYIFSLARTGPPTSSGPAAPSNVAASVVSGTSATITWTDNATNESGYLLYRVEGTTQTLVPCPPPTVNSTSCTDTGLSPGSYYQYYVYSWNSSDVGSPGVGTIVHTPRPLPAPVLTDATGINSRTLSLHWTDNASDETGYTVYGYYPSLQPGRPAMYRVVAELEANSTTATFEAGSPGVTTILQVSVNRGAEKTYAQSAIWATNPMGL